MHIKKIFTLLMLFMYGSAFSEEEHRGRGTAPEHHQEQRVNESRPIPPKIEVMTHPSKIEEKISAPQRGMETPRRLNQLPNEERAVISPANRSPDQVVNMRGANQPNRRFQSPSPLFNRGGAQIRFNNREEFRRFHEEDFRRWQSGRWVEGRVHGVFGWYWLIPGLGYYYFAEPVFPYPDPYFFYQNPEQIVFYQENSSETVSYSRPENEPQAFWYFCRPANMYYPYISQCPEEWEVVPAR